MMHWITQHPYSGYGDLDGIARNERTDPGRGAGSNQITRYEGHDPGNPADQKSDRERHMGGAVGLARVNWTSLFWRSRAVTSFKQV